MTEPIDILLIQTPNVTGSFFNLSGREVPLSLCSIAAYLRDRDFRVALIDLDFTRQVDRDLERALSVHRPRFVGLSAYTPNIAVAGRIAETIKSRNPDISTIIGGFHASALPEETMREMPAFDYLAVGEGEQTLAELLSGDPVENIAGLYSRNGSELHYPGPRPLIADLDTLPFPDRSLIPVTQYVPDPGNYFQLPSTGVLFSRGCPFRCTFCSKSVFGNRIRYRSTDNFLEEIKECIGRWGIRDFRLEDEAPTIKTDNVRNLSEAIIRQGIAITWSCFSRVDTVDAETLRLMMAAGCYHVTYGIESSLPETLERINKRIDIDQAEETVRMTKEIGIECKANFILGFPWEDADDMRKVVRYAKNLSPDLVTINLFKPLPGSALYNELKEQGKLRHTSWEDYFTTSEGLLFEAAYTEQEALSILRNAVFSFYFRPAYILQRFERVLMHPRREVGMLARGVFALLRELAMIPVAAVRRAFSPGDRD